MIGLLKSKYLWKLQVEGIVADRDIFKNILKNRGIGDAEHFFSMGEESLHDPLLIEGMDRAVDRVIKAISAGEKILIYGDYDCDGISAISVMYRTLKRMNANVSYDLPDRFQDGYGLNLNAVEKIIKDKTDLVITVDNGITCNDEVKALKASGIDAIVTDHHEGKGELPDAYQILHTKLSPRYPFKEIAGVMVAFKFCQALTNEKLDDLYDLVMIGTIADLVPLADENQAMVNLGLKQLKRTKNLGLKKLVEFSHLDIINETAIAFKIAPKINSSGRLGKAMQAVKLLVSESEKEVNDLIYMIEENHANRKDLTEAAVELCETIVDPQDDVLVIASEDIHEGVIGICAQKMAEKYQKTTIVITYDASGVGKGSARAFGDDNVLEMLEKNQSLLTRYGGHQQAAGLQLEMKNIEAFRQGLIQLTSRQEVPILKIDMELSLGDVVFDTVKKLQDLSFFTATFLFSGLVVTRKQLLNNKHTKLVVSHKGKSFDVLAFNNTEDYYSLEPGDIINAVGGLNINSWRTRTTLQVIVKDLSSEQFQILDFRNEARNFRELIRQKDAVEMNDLVLSTSRHLPEAMTLVMTPRVFNVSLHSLLGKEHLGRCYRTLEKTDQVSVKEAADLFGLFPVEARIVLSIFLDLGFVRQDHDLYHFQKPVEKRELDSSEVYRFWKDRSELVEKTYYLALPDLKQIYSS